MHFVLLDIFKTVEDPRDCYGREYRLEHILLFSVLAILGKMENYKDISIFIAAHFETLKTYFNLKWRRPPTHSAIWKILTAIDPLAIETAFRAHLETLEDAEKGAGYKHYCFDGKALRGSRSSSQKPVRVFEALSNWGQIVLAHVAMGDNKCHELAAFEKLLEELNVEGVIITADALHCQKKTLN
jgi:hypothetical protein